MTQTRFNSFGWVGTLVFTSVAISYVSAQTVFTWGPGLTDKSLQECAPVHLRVAPNPGQTLNPPFYVIAYEPGGSTTVSNIGSTPLNLTWIVDHSAGSRIIMQVVDSKGNSGGTGPAVYPINPGTSTTCHTNTPPSIQLVSNATALQTCDFLLLDITGGTKPYTLSIASINGQGAINATMGPNDNEYLWVNRANPNGQLVAVVSDANSQYSNVTPLITTSGIGDVTCGNLQSQSRIKGANPSGSTQAPTATKPPPKSTKSTATSSATSSQTSGAAARKSSGVVAGVVGGIGAALALIAAGFLFLRYRRRQQYDDDPYEHSAPKPEPFGLADESFGHKPPAPPVDYNYEQVGHGYGWNKDVPSATLSGYPHKAVPPTPGTAGTEPAYYEMTPASSTTRLTEGFAPPPPPAKSPPPVGAPPLLPSGYVVQNWNYPSNSSAHNLPSSLQAGGGRSRDPSPIPSYSKGVMLVDRVPNAMRGLQSQTPDRTASPSPHRLGPSYIPPHIATPPSQPYPPRGATPNSIEPASVLYAKSLNPVASSSTSYPAASYSQTQPHQLPQTITRTASHSNSLQVPHEDEDQEEGETLLAYYRTSVVSSDSDQPSSNASYPSPFKSQQAPNANYPAPLKSKAPSSSKGDSHPPQPEPRIHQHEDGGPVLEVPPAYRDQYPNPHQQ